MLSTIKLHNFSISTSSILIVSTSKVVYKIWISNLKTSQEFIYDKMISNQIVNYKISLHFKTYNCFIWINLLLQNVIFKLSLLIVQKNTRQRSSLLSIALGKEFLCRVFFYREFFCLALGKELLCRVPERKHSTNHLALGKEPNSGSGCRYDFITCHMNAPHS